MKIRDILFGKPVSKRFQDPVLGELTADVRPRHEHRWCSWRGQRVLDGGTRPTQFWLSGDGLAPDSTLVAEAHGVISALPDIVAMAASELQKHSTASRMDDFHLATISVWDDVDCVLELSFVTVRASGLREDLAFEWPAPGTSLTHRVRLHARAIPVPDEAV